MSNDLITDNVLDLCFGVIASQPVPSDHGYALYGAISRLLPEVHSMEGAGIHPLKGHQIGNRRISLGSLSTLTIRTPSASLAMWLPLAGKKIELSGTFLQLGVPSVRALTPSASLRSRLVTTKNALNQLRFETEIRRQLTELGVSESVHFEVCKRHPTDDQPSTPIRRTLRIKGKEVVGYELLIQNLTEAESILVQSRGLGGRRMMGCGIFTSWNQVRSTK